MPKRPRLRQTSCGQPPTPSASLGGHRPVRPAAGEQAIPAYNDAESPLAWLRSRRGKDGAPLITDVQYLAGEKLRYDYERSMLAGRVTANWDVSATANRTGGNRAAEISDAAIAARQRYHKAIDNLGPELAGIVVHVCCMAAGLEQAERVLELPKRSGKAVLGLALTALARHYGLLHETRKPRGIGQWGLPDYRPRIQVPEEA